MSKVRLDPGPFVLPMPTALIGAEVDGKPNFMTAAFVGIANYKPAIVACGLSPTHHTSRGIAAHGEFSLCLPGPDLVEATDWCGLNSGKRTGKDGVFETFSGSLAHAPMVRACRLAAECRVVRTVEFAVDTVYFGEVVGVYADEDVLRDGAPDWQRISPLLFTFPDKGYWEIGKRVADAWSVGKGYRPGT